MSDVQILFNHFDELLEQMLGNIETIVDDSAHDVKRDAQAAVAVHTGAEKASFYVSSSKGSDYADAVAEAEGDNPTGHIQPEMTPESKGEAVIGAAEEYALYDEFGTSHLPAHPALVPALENMRQKLIDRLSEGLFDE